MIEVLKAYPFHQPRETNPDPQNVLARQVNFPNKYSEEDYLFQIYTESGNEEEYLNFWQIADINPQRNELPEHLLKKFIPDLDIQQLDQQLEKISEEQFFSLGKFVAADLGYDRHSHGIDLTGFRVVRYTNRTTCHPYYRFDFYYTNEPENRKLYSGYSGNTRIWHLNMLL